MIHIDKPWGWEEIIEQNKHYVVKRLFMKGGACCSLQYHNKKHETIVVLNGVLVVQIGKGDTATRNILLPGDSIVIPPKIVHRMLADADSVYIESSTNHLDDVVRLEDSYGRVKNEGTNSNKRVRKSTRRTN